MPELRPMPPIVLPVDSLAGFGQAWTVRGGALSRTPPHCSMELGSVFDTAVAQALATMLGGIPVSRPSATALLPAVANCVELGPTRIIGGVRPQNFDVGYRPDGVRFVFDSKTLNDRDSVRKNYQNMINDLATEATTVHSRFPYAVVGFLVAIPSPALVEPQRAAITETLERLAVRRSVDDPAHQAEAIALLIWHPEDGSK